MRWIVIAALYTWPLLPPHAAVATASLAIERQLVILERFHAPRAKHKRIDYGFGVSVMFAVTVHAKVPTRSVR